MTSRPFIISYLLTSVFLFLSFVYLFSFIHFPLHLLPFPPLTALLLFQTLLLPLHFVGLYLSRYGPYYRRNRGNNNHQYFGGGSEHFSHLFTSPTSNTTAAAAATNGAETSGIISSAPSKQTRRVSQSLSGVK